MDLSNFFSSDEEKDKDLSSFFDNKGSIRSDLSQEDLIKAISGANNTEHKGSFLTNPLFLKFLMRLGSGMMGQPTLGQGLTQGMTGASQGLMEDMDRLNQEKQAGRKAALSSIVNLYSKGAEERKKALEIAQKRYAMTGLMQDKLPAFTEKEPVNPSVGATGPVKPDSTAFSQWDNAEKTYKQHRDSYDAARQDIADKVALMPEDFLDESYKEMLKRSLGAGSNRFININGQKLPFTHTDTNGNEVYNSEALVNYVVNGGKDFVMDKDSEGRTVLIDKRNPGSAPIVVGGGSNPSSASYPSPTSAASPGTPVGRTPSVGNIFRPPAAAPAAASAPVAVPGVVPAPAGLTPKQSDLYYKQQQDAAQEQRLRERNDLEAQRQAERDRLTAERTSIENRNQEAARLNNSYSTNTQQADIKNLEDKHKAAIDGNNGMNSLWELYNKAKTTPTGPIIGHEYIVWLKRALGTDTGIDLEDLGQRRDAQAITELTSRVLGINPTDKDLSFMVNSIFNPTIHPEVNAAAIERVLERRQKAINDYADTYQSVAKKYGNANIPAFATNPDSLAVTPKEVNFNGERVRVLYKIPGENAYKLSNGEVVRPKAR